MAALIGAIALLAVPAHAGSPDVPPPAEQIISTMNDGAMRMTVPVTIDTASGAAGPFHFVVDTGADRTVVSRELADRLALAPGKGATLHSISGVNPVSTVVVPALGLAGRRTANIHAPALLQAHLGAQGLLGLDSLQGRRVIMDFRAKTMTIAAPGTRERSDPDTIVVTAKSRYGQLLLVDASVDNIPITVIVDSGAENTIGNGALRAMLQRRHRRMEFLKSTLVDVTGGQLPAEFASVNNIKIGGLAMNEVTIAFADAHPFKRFGIADKPAMLLGMDTLRAFRRVSLDFETRKVRFLLPEES